MYQNQFVSLIQKLQQQMKPPTSLNRLLNDGDKRSALLQQAKHSGDRGLELLARRITTLEDLVPYRMRVDCVEKQTPKAGWKQLTAMFLFALANIGLIAGSVVAYENVKIKRIQAQQEVTEVGAHTVASN